MRMGYRTWVKALILSIFPNISFSNPFLGVFEASMTEYFMAGGVAQSQAKADAEALSKSVFDTQIKQDIQSGRYDFDDNSPYFKSSFDKQTSKNVEFREKRQFSDGMSASMQNPYKKGGEGILFHTMDSGNWQDKEIVRKMYKEDGFDIVFKTRTSYRELSEYIQSQSGVSYAIAPDWYGSTGIFTYRTELPINKDGDYFYSNSPMGFYEMGLGGGFIPMDENIISVEVGRDDKGSPLNIDIYKEEIELYSDEGDAVSSFSNSYDLKYTFDYLYEKNVYDFSGEEGNNGSSFQEAKNECESGLMDSYSSPNQSVRLHACISSILSMAYPIEEEGTGTLLLIKNRSDISEGNTLQDAVDNGDLDEYDFLSVYENLLNTIEQIKNLPSDVSEDDKKLANDRFEKVMARLEKYEINSDSLAEIYTSEIKHTLKSSSSDLGVSAQSRAMLDSSFELPPMAVSRGAERSGFSSGGGGGYSGSGVTMKDISQSLTTFRQWFDSSSGGRGRLGSIGGSSGIGDDVGGIDDSVTSPKPDNNIGDNVGGSSGSVGGVNGGTGSNTGIGGATGTGASDSGAVSGGSATGANSGATSGTGAGVTGEKAGDVSNSDSTTGTGTGSGTFEDADSDDEPDSLPLIPSAFDILKPLEDWKNSLLAKLNISSISGTCPDLQFDIFDSSVSTDVHCQIYEKIAHIISACMALVWGIMAFRIVFSA